MKKLIVLKMVVLILALVLTGCTGNPSNASTENGDLVGRWSIRGQEFVFHADATGYIDIQDGRGHGRAVAGKMYFSWESNGEQLIIQWESDGGSDFWQYQLNENQLTIDGNVFTRIDE